MEANNMTLEERVAMLEKEFAILKAQLLAKPPRVWWKDNAGMFADSPIFDEIVALGQAIREKERAEAEAAP
ncbi:MAG: hypothetical protein ONB46_06805 [candidate division KSB1 bacterium]|nr:hypothetical protein [candidate division KSB1 bacterium]MDZ7367187.1 hypothetical protein [candidate division KSB1 bacterium]MDZ7405330.1 hypothetical protein [candidate division KSB1 bacterium]